MAAHTVSCGNVALQPAPLPERSRQRRAPSGRFACRVGGPQPPPRAHLGPGPPPTLPRRPAPDSAAVPASMPPGAVDRAAGEGAGPHETRLDAVVTAVPPYRGVPVASTGRTRDETAATGRTDRHQTLDAGRAGH